MLKSRIRRRAAAARKAEERLVQVEASIASLNDEDLLDLADIFAGDPQGPLNVSATAEMAKRRLKP